MMLDAIKIFMMQITFLFFAFFLFFTWEEDRIAHFFFLKSMGVSFALSRLHSNNFMESLSFIIRCFTL